MEIDRPEVVAEVTAAFNRYEQALVSNDVATLDAIFRNDPRTIRYGGGENLYGYKEIEAFRAARSPAGLARTISKTVITTYGRDMAVASTLFHRTDIARQGRAADADLGALSRRLVRRRRPCQRDRRAEGLGLASSSPRPAYTHFELRRVRVSPKRLARRRKAGTRRALGAKAESGGPG